MRILMALVTKGQSSDSACTYLSPALEVWVIAKYFHTKRVEEGISYSGNQRKRKQARRKTLNNPE